MAPILCFILSLRYLQSDLCSFLGLNMWLLLLYILSWAWGGRRTLVCSLSLSKLGVVRLFEAAEGAGEWRSESTTIF